MASEAHIDDTTAHRRALGLFLWLLIGQKCLWHPMIVLRRHHLSGTVHWTAATSAALLFAAGLLLVVYRRRPAVWIMIAALWASMLLEWLRLAGHGPTFWSHLDFHGWLGWAGWIFSPVPWTAYLLESPVVAACFPRGDRTGAASTASSHRRRSRSHLSARLFELGPWISLWIFWRVVWTPLFLGDTLWRLEKLGRLWSSNGVAVLHPWQLGLGLSLEVGATIGALMIVFRRRRSTIMLVIILVWLLLLEDWAVDIGAGIDGRFLSQGAHGLIIAINYLFWPLSWTAYFMESARVARLYPRDGMAEAAAKADVF